jgi:hypothetical protein
MMTQRIYHPGLITLMSIILIGAFSLPAAGVEYGFVLPGGNDNDVELASQIPSFITDASASEVQDEEAETSEDAVDEGETQQPAEEGDSQEGEQQTGEESEFGEIEEIDITELQELEKYLNEIEVDSGDETISEETIDQGFIQQPPADPRNEYARELYLSEQASSGSQISADDGVVGSISYSFETWGTDYEKPPLMKPSPEMLKGWIESYEMLPIYSGPEDYKAALMRPNDETLHGWIANYNLAPAFPDSGTESKDAYISASASTSKGEGKASGVDTAGSQPLARFAAAT